ncbi:winged helix repair factor 1 isoform X2 [Buteo buteo]|uniref:winged helix repair factor 1 isoform X2 n=1 Tax=Buteo buteo TaxID=30397 RepID=UPI003EC0AFE4
MGRRRRLLCDTLEAKRRRLEPPPPEEPRPDGSPGSVEAALRDVAALFPRGLFGDALPPLVLRHQLYSLNHLRDEGRIRLLHLGLGADTLGVVFMEPYKEKATGGRRGADRARRRKLVAGGAGGRALCPGLRPWAPGAAGRSPPVTAPGGASTGAEAAKGPPGRPPGGRVPPARPAGGPAAAQRPHHLGADAAIGRALTGRFPACNGALWTKGVWPRRPRGGGVKADPTLTKGVWPRAILALPPSRAAPPPCRLGFRGGLGWVVGEKKCIKSVGFFGFFFSPLSPP